MADKCADIRAEIAVIKMQMRAIPRVIVDDDPRPGNSHKPMPNPDYQELKEELLDAEMRLRDNGCIQPSPPAPPAVPVPLALRAEGLRCFQQNDIDRGTIFDIEDDEPYLLAFAVDIAAPTNSKITRIGPIEHVDDDEDDTFFALPGNLIWGLSEAPQLVSSADKLICIVALMENDDANTNQVREVVEIDMKARLVTEGIAFASGQIPRDELIRRLINAMNGTLPIASTAFPGPDDQIGSAQELRFSQAELDSIYRDKNAVIKKTLHFEGDGAKYDVFFKLSR